MISTKSKYGIRALLYMALQGSEVKISIKEIAEKENISGRYLEQIFSTLKQGGIVKSLKGASGGYIFFKEIKNIKIKELIELLEKDIYCEIDDSIDSGSLETTLNEVLWREYNKKISDFFDELSLEDLVEKHKENKNLMYYI
ncbi:MAG: Rrf2 family transcriptional regulator [Fusobacteriaceae bacterium]|nr:Rrf2 family transcriptional regulator [Fusobacteriaceae bacterium]MBN2838322.1 Rrf2 family transcriptional regulator [Fusobacteriaceae bacterium]